jgi:methionyl aminopeptidase
VFRDRGVEIKTPSQIETMRAAGLVVGETLALLRASARAGMTTGDLDALAAENIRAAGAKPSFLGYGHPPFPATICVSVNDEIVHGIPGDRVIAEGDIVSIDCGAIVDGWHGDAAISVIVGADPSGGGAGTAEDRALVDATEQSMWHGIRALRPGARLYDVGAGVEDFVVGLAANGGPSYGIVEDYVGHGIGRSMHEDPQVPNYRVRAKGPRVAAGLCVAVEPMLTAGSAQTRTLDDGWTVVTVDGGRAAHWEHSVAVTARGPWGLTARDGGAAGLGQLGETPGGLD